MTEIDAYFWWQHSVCRILELNRLTCSCSCDLMDARQAKLDEWCSADGVSWEFARAVKNPFLEHYTTKLDDDNVWWTLFKSSCEVRASVSCSGQRGNEASDALVVCCGLECAHNRNSVLPLKPKCSPQRPTVGSYVSLAFQRWGFPQ